MRLSQTLQIRINWYLCVSKTQNMTPKACMKGLTILSFLCMAFSASVAQTGNVVYLENGLSYEILKPGNGSDVKEYDVVILHEWLRDENGNLLFSTDQTGKPVEFQVGKEQAIDGLDIGVRGMKMGERRRIVVPPALSQRETYPDGITPGMTLHYEVEVVDILR